MENRKLNDYVEMREGGYYVAGTRISLDSIVYEFKRGASAEDIQSWYPLVGSLERVYGAITFYLANKDHIEEYLAGRKLRREQLKAEHPLPSELRERLLRARNELVADRT